MQVSNGEEGYQLIAISYQLSAISYQLSAISYQLSALRFPQVIYKNFNKAGIRCRGGACPGPGRSGEPLNLVVGASKKLR